MIELDGSNAVTRRPTDSDIAMTGDDGVEEATPIARALKTTEYVDTEPEPYQTPVALTPANWREKTRTPSRRVAPVEDADIESSDEEIQILRVKKKKQRVAKSATDSDKVTSHLLKS